LDKSEQSAFDLSDHPLNGDQLVLDQPVDFLGRENNRNQMEATLLKVPPYELFYKENSFLGPQIQP
jgi:hypothetical protein